MLRWKGSSTAGRPRCGATMANGRDSRASALAHEALVIVVGADPEPDHRVVGEDAERAAVDPDAYGVDRAARVNEHTEAPGAGGSIGKGRRPCAPGPERRRGAGQKHAGSPPWCGTSQLFGIEGLGQSAAMLGERFVRQGFEGAL